jgi:histone-lysine N-methyltransferase SUV39H
LRPSQISVVIPSPTSKQKRDIAIAQDVSDVDGMGNLRTSLDEESEVSSDKSKLFLFSGTVGDR